MQGQTQCVPDLALEKYKSDLELIRRIGKRADEVSMARFLAQDLIIETKPDATPRSEEHTSELQSH